MTRGQLLCFDASRYTARIRAPVGPQVLSLATTRTIPRDLSPSFPSGRSTRREILGINFEPPAKQATTTL